MHLVVIGVNHKTAPIGLRERLAVGRDELDSALADLTSNPRVDEACILSTCNRTEIYAVTASRSDDEAIVDFLCRLGEIDCSKLEDCIYRYPGHHAVNHLYEVASGLDSMSLGENQILGQVKNAYCAASDSGCTATVLNNLMQSAITVGKRARTQTNISAGAFSIGAAAVELAKVVFSGLDGRRALLLGTGDMGKLAAVHLREHGVEDIYIAGRTRAKAEQLARDLSGEVVDFDRFEDVLGKVDFLISSTGSPEPIITRDQMERVRSQEVCSPIFLIDIAVPRDVAPDVAELDGVFVYTIDDLRFLVEQKQAEREAEAEKVRVIIEEETAEFMEFLRTLEAVPLIKQLRSKLDSIYDIQWRKYSSKLAHLPEEDRENVRKMMRSLLKKLSHDPILRIKDYAADNVNSGKLDTAAELFGLGGEPDHKKRKNPTRKKSKRK